MVAVTPAVTALAERATLGALLAAPRQLAHVAGWLRPGDFAHWWHAAVYRALLADPAVAARGDPVAAAEHVRAALADTVGQRRADPPGLHTLLRAAPDRPVAARYAAMVLEASIRRQVAGLAVHLQAAAAVPDPTAPDPTPPDRPVTSVLETPRPRGGGPVAALDHHDAAAAAAAAAPRPVRDVTGLVEPVLGELGARWAAAVRATSTPDPDRADVFTARGDDVAAAVQADDRRTVWLRGLAAAADRAVRHAPVRSAAEARADTTRLVAALVTRPDRLDTVAGWLRPEGVPGPARAVYEALLTLRQQHAPIDPVTVCWEIQRASRARGLGPDPARLLRQVQAAELLDLDALTRAVAHDTLRRTAAAAADGLRAAASNPGLTVGDVLDAAAWAAQAVTRAAADTAPSSAGPGPATPAPPSAPTAGGARVGVAEADRLPEPKEGRWRRSRLLSPVPDRSELRVLR